MYKALGEEERNNMSDCGVINNIAPSKDKWKIYLGKPTPDRKEKAPIMMMIKSVHNFQIVVANLEY